MKEKKEEEKGMKKEEKEAKADEKKKGEKEREKEEIKAEQSFSGIEELIEVDKSIDEAVLSESEKAFVTQFKAEQRRNIIVFVSTLVIMIAVIFISFMLGRYPVSPDEVIKIIASNFMPIDQTWENVQKTVVMSVRVPRILAALAVGGCLAVAGAAYQGLFRNPMVSPDLLGASAGASVGACLMMLFSLGAVFIQIGAFAMGLIAVGLSYYLSKALGKGGNMILLLVLCGMTVRTLFQAFVSIIQYLADPDSQLPAITYWLMGSIAKVTYSDLLFFIAPFVIGIVPIMAFRWRLNILSFGEDEAKALGINVSFIRGIYIFCATLLAAAVVSIAGTIGWVGLMIPHLVRFMTGPNNKTLIPLSFFVGATFMLIVDNFCRTLMSYEIPLGVLTSLLGAPFFIYILYRGRGNM